MGAVTELLSRRGDPTSERAARRAAARGRRRRAAARPCLKNADTMTEGGSKHSAQIKIDLFPQMRAGWRGSWGKMGGQAMKAGEIALAGPHSCYWGGS
eukprot:COSAG02_NODE_42_length_46522_cov_109.704478_23_plen_98_part_00